MSLFKLKKLLPQAAKRSLYKYDCKNLGHGSSEEENLDSLIKSLEIVSPRPICHPPLHVIKNEIGIDLSIIIPVYNAQNFLGKCIDSCLGQRTEFSFEVIAVDDGSTDDSLAMLRNYDFDHRLKVIHQKNRGHAGARNAALDVASGSYICFVDSDDFIPRDAVQRLMSRAIELDADIVGGGIGTATLKVAAEDSRVCVGRFSLSPQRVFRACQWERFIGVPSGMTCVSQRVFGSKTLVYLI